MTRPDPELLRLYGTTKEANDLATAARIAAAVLGLGLMSSDHSHVEEKEREATAEGELQRANEAGRMSAVQESLKSAAAAGQVMALGTRVKNALKPGFKTKALAYGGLAAAGYGGYKGLSALRDYASSPKGGDELWDSKRPLPQNVSEWGYPIS